MNWHDKTIEVYDKSAAELAEYFSTIGSRTDDIKLALDLLDAPSKQARAVEIGCGDGRDAQEIVGRVAWYEGFDPSKKLLDIAINRNIKEAHFRVDDALSYAYPDNLDIVYSFASLLHVNKSDLKIVFEKVAKSLKAGGIFYISLKERPEYTEEIKSDKHGDRMFYYYNPEIIQQIAGDKFKCLYTDRQKIGKTDWFTIALKKI